MPETIQKHNGFTQLEQGKSFFKVKVEADMA